MNRVQITRELAESLTQISPGDRILLSHEGQDFGVVISLNELSLLEEMEDRLDSLEFRKAKQESTEENLIPWSQIKEECGL